MGFLGDTKANERGRKAQFVRSQKGIHQNHWVLVDELIQENASFKGKYNGQGTIAEDVGITVWQIEIE